MRISYRMDPLTLDPQKSSDIITSDFLSMVFEGLTRLNANGTVELALAESYRIFDDGRTYEFMIREAYWSNGDPILAKDFEISWKRVLSPHFQSLATHMFFNLLNGEKARNGQCDLSQVGVQAVEARKLRVSLENPCPHFLSLISFCNFFPIPRSIENKTPLDLIDVSMVPVSGPFRIISWQKKEAIQLQKNHLYWDEKNVASDELTIYICQNPYLVLQMFREGRLDLICNTLSPIPNEELKKADIAKLLRVTPVISTLFCSFNNSSFPFSNKNIRKAFSFAINRLEFDSDLLGTPALRFLPRPLALGTVNPIAHDPIKAKDFLKLGMNELDILTSREPNSFKFRMFSDNLVLISSDSLPQIKTARFLQEQWKKHLNLHVEVKIQSFHSYLDKISSGRYSIGIVTWIAPYMDPTSILERFKNKNAPRNHSQFESQKYSEILSKLNETSDVPLRIQLMNEAENLLIEEVPMTPIYHGERAIIMRSGFDKVIPLPNGAFRFTQCVSSNHAA